MRLSRLHGPSRDYSVAFVNLELELVQPGFAMVGPNKESWVPQSCPPGHVGYMHS